MAIGDAIVVPSSENRSEIPPRRFHRATAVVCLQNHPCKPIRLRSRWKETVHRVRCFYPVWLKSRLFVSFVGQ